MTIIPESYSLLLEGGSWELWTDISKDEPGTLTLHKCRVKKLTVHWVENICNACRDRLPLDIEVTRSLLLGGRPL